MNKNILNALNCSDEKINRIIDEMEKEIESNLWRNEKRFNDFLNIIVKYVNKNKSLCSDSFDYKESSLKDKIDGSFSVLLNSLYDKVDSYAYENFIFNKFNISKDDYFTDNSYCLKIDDKFYNISLVVGQ